MAFWGILVKPGKPITHSCEKARGRLRISQATLGNGIGDAMKKTVVQCNVGKRAPVLLCALLPDKTESCHLDLEFEEADDVIFSVIGPRSVYLTGYYVRQIPHLNAHSDTESYGVDIENTQTEGSSYGSDEDKYEDSFINDDEQQASPQSPVLNSKDDIEPKHRKGPGKQQKKNPQLVSDNEDDCLPESEDEDSYTLSAFKARRTLNIVMSDEEDAADVVEVGNKENDKGVYDGLKKKHHPSVFKAEEDVAELEPISEVGREAPGKNRSDVVLSGFEPGMMHLAKDNAICLESKQEGDPLDINEPGRVVSLPFDEVTNNGKKMDDLSTPKEAETFKGFISSNEDAVADDRVKNDAKDSVLDQNLAKEKDKMEFRDSTKPKKKRRKLSARKEKPNEIQVNNTDNNVLLGDKEEDNEAPMNLDSDANCAEMLLELGSPSGHRVKKKFSELQPEGQQTEHNDRRLHDIPKEDTVGPLLQNSNSNTENLPATSGEHLRVKKNSTKGIDSINDSILEKEEADPGLQQDNMEMDPPASNNQYQEQKIDNDAGVCPEAKDRRSEKKKNKKQKKKAEGKGNLGTDMLVTTDGEETMVTKFGNENTDAVPIKKRTLSDGLIVEELANGPPDLKVAATGKKIKIYYTGMLKENAFVFESNVGKSPFKFRLGDKEYIDGWNVGIDGMHVGDKRRLIIPPSLGFGNSRVGDIPPSSWLVYDVELVSVHK
ncbi:peptidyl-prolyl cis-trans isomerase FKBP53-like [Andrographis paniculata]|uniref:peptidyl-prolyl cis-trans isomerase FKBP53-like n=1 Tax=Andrographis paniculata TaxID=175694 RepID=UPI0021E6E618|nr:peptidyl-prolyl cis-trans isomerase FKBP53-like [Andrographis paniculata]